MALERLSLPGEGLMKRPWFSVATGMSVLVFSGFLLSRADDTTPPLDEPEQLTVEHPECVFFGSDPEKYMDQSVRPARAESTGTRLGRLTQDVSRLLSYVPGGSRTYSFDQSHQSGSIDSYTFADFQAHQITPAPKTNDWEFIRRVTLDLTGRIPTPDRVLRFVADTASDKRAKLIEELLASPQWIDKWTMFYGDLFQNTVNRPSTALVRFAQGRNAFYQWIKDSLANRKPYNQMATELISTAAQSSYDDGRI